MKPADEAIKPLGVVAASVFDTRSHDRIAKSRPDWLVDEVPVALVFNGISYAVMLASPTDLEDFALGFGLTEGLLLRPSELRSVEIEQADEGIELHLEVAAACEMRMKHRRRALAGKTGCGLCGTESLAQVQRPLPAGPKVTASPAAVARAHRMLRSTQPVAQLTGASHAAAWCDRDGEVRLTREDVGRHNALDKLVGAMNRDKVDAAEGFICVTSRASFEMVQKTAISGAGMLAAVSAPTALAVRIAHACGLALAGFVRNDDLVAYTFPERFGIKPDAAQSLQESVVHG